jgi:hypothetical protein
VNWSNTKCALASQILELERNLGNARLAKRFRELQQDRLEQDQGSKNALDC